MGLRENRETCATPSSLPRRKEDETEGREGRSNHYSTSPSSIFYVLSPMDGSWPYSTTSTRDPSRVQLSSTKTFCRGMFFSSSPVVGTEQVEDVTWNWRYSRRISDWKLRLGTLPVFRFGVCLQSSMDNLNTYSVSLRNLSLSTR